MMVPMESMYFNRAAEVDRGPCVTNDRNPLPIKLGVYIEKSGESVAVVLKDPIREKVYARATSIDVQSGAVDNNGFYNNIPGVEAEMLMTSILSLTCLCEQDNTAKTAALTLCDFESEGAILANGHSIKIDYTSIAPQLKRAKEILEAADEVLPKIFEGYRVLYG